MLRDHSGIVGIGNKKQTDELAKSVSLNWIKYIEILNEDIKKIFKNSALNEWNKKYWQISSIFKGR